MAYTPEDNPYNPGDPYSYDLKWLVRNIKQLRSAIDILEKSYTAPVPVDTAAQMTDRNKIYLYVGNDPGLSNNHWYYYDPDSSSWIDGGAYGTASINLPIAIEDGGTGETTAADGVHALIDGLSSAVELNTSDYLIKDDGTAKKIEVSNAYADDTHPGLVSTSSQIIAGAKTFKNNIMLQTGGQYPAIDVLSADGNRLSEIYTNKGDNVNYTNGQMCFVEYAPKSVPDEESNGHFETFRLPAPTPGRNTNQPFDILTTKDISLTTLNSDNISSSYTKIFDVGNISVFLMMIDGATSGDKGLYIFFCNSVGSVTYAPVLEASNAQITTTTNGFTVYNSGANTMFVRTFVFSGSVTPYN